MRSSAKSSIVKWKWVFVLGWILTGISLVIALWTNISHHVDGAVVWQHSGLMTLAFILGATGISLVLGSLRDENGNK